ncbi:hypothetical protein QE367_000394 [Microbacterium paludicola]|uniref:Uncharacterized protein n=1 Tax=Microbacterium paludicola TaxID=300019 RepID=A0ABU1HX29_9MICO|nr:hypothetical protein [Microbacterium paludicola]MDR6166190.1 hypothetical protein [Microbacterium paludicola]
MNEPSVPTDIAALKGQHVEVEEVDLIEDAESIPSRIDVLREMATVVVPSLLQAPAEHPKRVPAEPEVKQQRQGVAM